MKSILYCLLFFCSSSYAQTYPDITAKYIKTPTGFLMVLNQGDSLIPHLEALAIREKIPSASLSAMGFVNAIFGFYNRESKTYDPRAFTDVELASLNGSIAWQNNKPSLHLHGVVTGSDFRAYGGHLLSAAVGTGSVEITITLQTKKLERKVDESIGANVLQVQ